VVPLLTNEGHETVACSHAVRFGSHSFPVQLAELLLVTVTVQVGPFWASAARDKDAAKASKELGAS
jgi:hypothetical protein